MKLASENPFVFYEFTEDEEIEAAILTTLQKNWLRNKSALIAQARFNEIPTANDFSSFIQTEAAYKGRLDVIKTLLDESDAAELAKLQKAQMEIPNT